MLKRPDIKIVIGKTGSGKTLKALRLLADCPRCIIFDTLGHDYTAGVVVYSIRELRKYWRRVYRGNFRIIYRPIHDVIEFEGVCQLAYDCGNLTLLAEEMDIFCRPQQTPFAFTQLLKRGRHRDIHFVGVTQRPIGIDRTITSQANEVFVFKTDEPRDLDYLRDRLGAEAADKIPTLQEYEYLHWQGAGVPVTIGKEIL
jgi:hypothetical protein